LIKGSKLPEKEVDEKETAGATGIVKAVQIQEKDGKTIFAVRKGGQAKIYNHFMSFHINRMTFEGRPKQKEDPELQELKEMPVISDKSKKIAEEARKKQLGEFSNSDIVTQLYEKEKVRQ
jgi:hypothetical protein